MKTLSEALKILYNSDEHEAFGLIVTGKVIPENAVEFFRTIYYPQQGDTWVRIASNLLDAVIRVNRANNNPGITIRSTTKITMVMEEVMLSQRCCILVFYYVASPPH